MGSLALSLALSLLLTLLLESAVFLFSGKRNRRDLLLLLLVNVLTNPPVVLLYWLAFAYTGWNRLAVKAVLEVGAVLVEARYYRRYGRTYAHPLRFSLAANGVSYGFGVLLQWLL